MPEFTLKTHEFYTAQRVTEYSVTGVSTIDSEIEFPFEGVQDTIFDATIEVGIRPKDSGGQHPENRVWCNEHGVDLSTLRKCDKAMKAMAFKVLRAAQLDAVLDRLKPISLIGDVAKFEWPVQPHMEDSTDFEETREYAEELASTIDGWQDRAKEELGQ